MGQNFSWLECTTTTSRKPLRRSLKNLRWKHMHLLLRADQRLKQNHNDVLLPAHLQRKYPSGKESGLEDYSPVAFPVSKWLTTLLCHGDLPREDDGAIEFWRLKECLRNDLVQSQHWSDGKWKSSMAGGGGGEKERFQYCSDPSGQEILSPSSSRSFRTQSHWSFTTWQCVNSGRHQKTVYWVDIKLAQK